jgi:hypothetical protein
MPPLIGRFQAIRELDKRPVEFLRSPIVTVEGGEAEAVATGVGIPEVEETTSSDEATLRQFEVLWAEIARRSNAQQAIIAATVTGTVGGLVVSGKASRAGHVRFVIFIVAVTIVFLGPATGGLSASVCHLDGQLRFIAAWAGSATLTALFAISWGIQVCQSWSESSSQSVT